MKKLLLYFNLVLGISLLVCGYTAFNITFQNPLNNIMGDIFMGNYYLDNKVQVDIILSNTYKINLTDNNILYYTPQQLQQLFKLSYGEVSKNITNPCQLYAYLWSFYFEYNDYDVQYIFIDGHTFVIASNELGYYLADQIELKYVAIN